MPKKQSTMKEIKLAQNKEVLKQLQQSYAMNINYSSYALEDHIYVIIDDMLIAIKESSKWC